MTSSPFNLRIALILCLLVGLYCGCANSLRAAIIPTGDFSPVYPGFDPWNVGGDLHVGETGVGTLDVSAGSVVNSVFGYVGNQVGSQGTVSIDGAGSRWDSTHHVFVGHGGNGMLAIENGGVVAGGMLGYVGHGASAVGTITVTGVGSQLSFGGGLDLGYAGTGTLTIENGGVLTANNVSVLGRETGSHGTATVTGPTSQWNMNSTFIVGLAGDGTLDIVNGGQVATLGGGSIGFAAGSQGSATVSGSGTLLHLGISLNVGQNGQGALTIDNGGTAEVGRDLVLGYLGTGELNINAAGVAHVTRTTVLGQQGGGSGTINFAGGVLNTASIMASPDHLTGTGTINTKTLVSDLNLVFDSIPSLQQQVILNSLPGQNITLNIDVSDPTNDVPLGAGYRGTGSLRIENGRVISSGDGYLGRHAGAQGTATVTGAGSRWNTNRFIIVGDHGTGTLSIESGGVVNSNANFNPSINPISTIADDSGSQGAVLVTGAGSEWIDGGEIRVGDRGQGSLEINSAGMVSNVDGAIGVKADSSGTVTVTGPGSQWNLSQGLEVGDAGNGQLKIEAGGQVSNNDHGYIGRSAGSQGAATVSGAGSLWSNSSRLVVGQSGAGELTVENGGVVNNQAGYFGFDLGSSGAATVSGPGSQWNNSGVLQVGRFGSGDLVIEDGALVTNDQDADLGYYEEASGSVDVTGSGSRWVNSDAIYVGRSGTGHLQIQSGAEVVNRDAYIGRYDEGVGTVSVAGAGSLWEIIGRLRIGESGTAELLIDAGAVVNNDEGAVGYQASAFGAATVKGPGSQWNNDGDLRVGSTGSGELYVQDGAVVNNDAGSLATLDLQSSGTAHVSGAGSQWHNSSILTVGGAGTGELTIQAGGVVTNDFAGYLGYHESAVGLATVTGSGSRWDITGRMVVGFSGRGTLNIENGGAVNIATDLKIAENATASGTVNLAGGELDLTGGIISAGSGIAAFNFTGGRLKHVSTFDTGLPLIQQGGTLAPGASPGMTAIVGDYVQQRGATIEIELHGVNNQGVDYDHLDISGDANISGILDLQIGGGYMPTLGEEADIMTFGSLTGRFASITNVVQAGGLGLAVRYGHDANQIDLRVSLRGDTDFDNDVDTGDLTNAIINFNGGSGSGNAWIEGDFDGDGDTDTGDLTAAIVNFTGGSAANANVPDLIYDPATGNVSIDSDGADVISFSLQAGPFSAADFDDLPAGLTDNIASQIGWTSFNLFTGLTGVADLGAILPAGLDLAGLEAALTTASYGLALSGGGGGGRLDLIIPEPTSIVLMGCGAMALVRRRCAA